MPGSTDQPTAEPFLPKRLTLASMALAVQGCRGCDLYRDATQAVFGEGPGDADLMLVGEVPGDQEDKAGHPFVGPAGRMLDQAMEAVGIPRDRVYITNAVKHFKFTQRGKRRIHARPNLREIRACQPWLRSEIEVVKPKMLVAMGATAGQALFGSTFRVTRQRGTKIESDWAPWVGATVHPSSLLRMPDEESRRAAWNAFLADFEVFAKAYREVAGAR